MLKNITLTVLFKRVHFRLGLENVCVDIEYMLGMKTGPYWRFCWGLITPLMMIVVFMYALVSSEQLKFGDYVYPTAGYGMYLLFKLMC